MNSRLLGKALVPVLIVGGIALAVANVLRPATGAREVPISEVTAQIKAGNVAKLTVTGDRLLVKIRDQQPSALTTWSRPSPRR